MKFNYFDSVDRSIAVEGIPYGAATIVSIDYESLYELMLKYGAGTDEKSPGDLIDELSENRYPETYSL